MRKDLFDELLKSVQEAKAISKGLLKPARVTTIADLRARKWQRLRAAGWRVGTVAEFLGLSDIALALLEMRLCLGRSLKSRRIKRRVTQTVLAKQLRSSQSRVAKMEAGDSSVSLELLIRALLIVGASRKDVAAALGARVA